MALLRVVLVIDVLIVGLVAAAATATPQSTIIREILANVVAWQHQAEGGKKPRPFITLTFAQSLDGKIAISAPDNQGTTSSNLAISGKESLLLTHALRSCHDAILVGGRTLSIDNPRLTNRLWEDASGGGRRQPRPVVVDPSLRHIQQFCINKTEKKSTTTIKASNVIVCCTHQAAKALWVLPDNVQLLPCNQMENENNMIDLHDMVRQLMTVYGIRSIMVEGGSAMLTLFLNARLVDYLCITIAPKIIGQENGLPSIARINCVPWIDLLEGGGPKYFTLGNDIILHCSLSSLNDSS